MGLLIPLVLLVPRKWYYQGLEEAVAMHNEKKVACGVSAIKMSKKVTEVGPVEDKKSAMILARPKEAIAHTG